MQYNFASARRAVFRAIAATILGIMLMRLLACVIARFVAAGAAATFTVAVFAGQQPATQPIEPIAGTQVSQASQAGAEVNLLAMGDWGTGGEGQRQVAHAMADYVLSAQRPFDGMLLV